MQYVYECAARATPARPVVEHAKHSKGCRLVRRRWSQPLDSWESCVLRSWVIYEEYEKHAVMLWSLSFKRLFCYLFKNSVLMRWCRYRGLTQVMRFSLQGWHSLRKQLCVRAGNRSFVDKLVDDVFENSICVLIIFCFNIFTLNVLSSFQFLFFFLPSFSLLLLFFYRIVTFLKESYIN